MPNDEQQEKILIVDDDIQIQQLLMRYLTEQGYSVDAVGDGKDMNHWLEKNQADLIILDLMLPGEDGLSLARHIRNKNTTPIIILSARGDEMDKIIGLEVGADDYLSKPFNPRELLARIRAVLRRGCSQAVPNDHVENSASNQNTPSESSDTLIHFGDFTLNVDNRILMRAEDEIDLTSGEMSLLIIFATRPRRVLNRDQLMDSLNAGDAEPFDRSIDVRITRLRRKLDDSGSKPRFIRTVWGQGYRFTPDDHQHEET